MTIANIPDFRVTLGDTDLTPKLKGSVRGADGGLPRPRLISLTITERRGGEADQLDLVLDDSDGAMALPPTGAVLHVSIGWAQGSDVTPGLVDKGSFTVDEVQHSGPPDAVTIRARSADFTGNLKVRREQGWHGTTLGAIVAEIAGRQHLTPRCAPALASIAVDAKAQSRESDMAFLRRLGREHDAVATIKRGALILSPIGSTSTATGKALPAITIHRRDGDTHTYRVEKRDEAAGVTASWHDRKGAKKQHVTVGKADGAKTLSRTYATEADARTAAQAAKSRAGRQPVSLDLTLALGRADLYPEQRTTVSGYKPAIDTIGWLISDVTHTIGDRGFSTGLKLEAA